MVRVGNLVDVPIGDVQTKWSKRRASGMMMDFLDTHVSNNNTSVSADRGVGYAAGGKLVLPPVIASRTQWPCS